jgi:hypothetical protein
VLCQVLDDDIALSFKTRLVDVVGCPDSLWHAPYGRRLAQKHVDFVLFNPVTGTILAVLELDDKTHDQPERQKRDQFLNRVLAQAHIPLIRIRAARRYDAQELRLRLTALLQSRTPADALCNRSSDPRHNTN